MSPLSTALNRNVHSEEPILFPRADRPYIRHDGNRIENYAERSFENLKASFEEFDVVYDRAERILWQYMKPQGRPSYTMGLLRDIRRLQGWLAEYGTASEEPGKLPVRYTVFASRIPGIFNMGGDLPLFVRLIEAQDRAGLTAYAHACVDAQYARIIKFGLPIVSISLVQGDALGGGFECALADDMIVAERSAKFGLPEILFNLFPGMGAYSLLSRRLDTVRAEKMILSGRIYSAAELADMGLVDVLAEDGEGEDALRRHVQALDRSYNARSAVYRARQMVNPVSHRELIEVTDLWVEAALNLGVADLRRMQRLAAAQDRRLSTQQG